MDRKFSYIGLAAAAALIGQQALAQSATVDASANVVSGQGSLNIEPETSPTFGEVAIPLSDGNTCRYVIGFGNNTLLSSVGDVNVNVDTVSLVHGPQGSSGPTANPEPNVCRYSGTQQVPVFAISCAEGVDVTVTIGSEGALEAESNYIYFRAFNPLDTAFSAVGSATRTANCPSNGLRFVPAMELSVSSISAPYNGTVGTITAEVSY